MKYHPDRIDAAMARALARFLAWDGVPAATRTHFAELLRAVHQVQACLRAFPPQSAEPWNTLNAHLLGRASLADEALRDLGASAPALRRFDEIAMTVSLGDMATALQERGFNAGPGMGPAPDARALQWVFFAAEEWSREFDCAPSHAQGGAFCKALPLVPFPAGIAMRELRPDFIDAALTRWSHQRAGSAG